MSLGWSPRVLRGPSSTRRDLWLLVKEGEVQPGLLALQTLDGTRGDGIIPETVGTEIGISPWSCSLILVSAPVLPTDQGMGPEAEET